MVADAEIVILNKATGVETRTQTTNTGAYRVPYVQPGAYSVSVSVSGFNTEVHDNIQVLMAQTVTVDFELKVGEVRETVTVSSETPLLEASTSEIGTNSTELEVHTWPILISDGARQLQSFIFRAMPGTQGGGWDGSINGGQAFSHDIAIDGITLGRMDITGGSNTEFTPTMDAVNEFKLQTGAISAQYGNTQTGISNFGLKSGTNEFHGSAFWFHQDAALNARSWYAATMGSTKDPLRLNNFGVTVGGPVIKDKTFFFFSYDGLRNPNFSLSSSLDSAPTKEFKTGDFSRLLDPNFTLNPQSGSAIGVDALGRAVIFGQIYDPATTRQLADGAWVRDPFPGNKIPANRISSVTRNFLEFDIPDPTFPQGVRLLKNITRYQGSTLNIDNVSVKLDHAVSDHHKVSGSLISNDRNRSAFGGGTYQVVKDFPGPYAQGNRLQTTPGWIVRWAEDWTVSPTKLNHFAVGYNRFVNRNQATAVSAGKNWAGELGLKGVPGGATLPAVTFGGANSYLSGSYRQLGHEGTEHRANGSVILADDFTWIRGNHSLRFGGEHRRYFENVRLLNTPGRYAFNSDQTALSNFSSGTGFAYASFLLGAARDTSATITNLTPGQRSRSTAFYVQDDWKVDSRLTLNLGLRWDLPSPFTEVKDRFSVLNPTKPNPGADGYLGALDFLGNCPGCNGRHRWTDTYFRQWAPRLGFAYAISQKLVVRGGYGINYSPPIFDSGEYNVRWFTGYNGSNSITRRTGRPGNGNDPAYFWDASYPVYPGTLPNYDPAQLNDSDISIYPADSNRFPMVQNWNLGVQYEMPWRVRLEANYIGNHGSRLNDGLSLSLNQVDPKHLSLGDILLEDISLHPEVKKPYPSFEGTVAQALRPFPQYQNITAHRTNEGWSKYNALQVTATKRTGAGLSFLLAYTFSKALGTTDSAATGYGGYGQDLYNRKADYAVSYLNCPQDLRITWIYDLPLGKNRRFMNSGPLSYILGGWTISALQGYRSGAPIRIGNSGGPDTGVLFNNSFYVDNLLPRDQQVLSKPTVADVFNGVQYLNPAAWGAVPVTENNVPLRFGTGVRYLPDLRGFARGNEDFSVMKRTPLKFREGATFEIRADFTNVFNRTWYRNPETDLGDPSRFGKVFGKYGGGRQIQVGARLTF